MSSTTEPQFITPAGEYTMDYLMGLSEEQLLEIKKNRKINKKKDESLVEAIHRWYRKNEFTDEFIINLPKAKLEELARVNNIEKIKNRDFGETVYRWFQNQLKLGKI